MMLGCRPYRNKICEKLISKVPQVKTNLPLYFYFTQQMSSLYLNLFINILSWGSLIHNLKVEQERELA